MEDLLRLLPTIRRTRGNRLYAADGSRILDLWMDDGRGILGERDKATRTWAANAADKGLVHPYPGLYERRFEKAVLTTWPELGSVRVFLSEERALDSAARILGSATVPAESPCRDAEGKPAHGPGTLVLLRPFTVLPAGVTLALLRLPCPRPFAPACLAVRDSRMLDDCPGDLVPSLLLAAAARGLASIEVATTNGYGEDHWKRFDRFTAPFFDRNGPYLFARIERSRYEEFYRAALSGGALVSPDYDKPSIVPPDFDDGELKKLAKALDGVRSDR
ncbi:MAG: hypothetical protein E4H20_06905 [Spirochaetales bacterium]|nr:MAG: hypothetical protein E4H20_06905 [Spirochaetales bacterium]